MQLAVDILEIAGFLVIQANNAQEGIALAKSELPDLILMDIGMPVMDGLTATKIIKEDSAINHIPMLLQLMP